MWTALSASRDTGNVGPANFSTSTSEFLTPVSPHSLVPAPVSPFQGGPDLYHLHPAGTKALPPSLVPTSIPYLSTLVTEICLWHIYLCWHFHSVHIKPFLGTVEILNVWIYASFKSSFSEADSIPSHPTNTGNEKIWNWKSANLFKLNSVIFLQEKYRICENDSYFVTTF